MSDNSFRIAQLRCMHDTMCFANDENLYMRWVTYGVPDCPSEDDFESIAECDESYNETVDLFVRLVAHKGFRG